MLPEKVLPLQPIINISGLTPYIFYKDKRSVFLGCNRSFANLVGLENPEEIRGKTDYSLPWANTFADLYRERDQAVLDGVAIDNMMEPHTKSNGDNILVIVNKLPLINQKGNKIGVIGSFIELPQKILEPNDNIEKLLTEKQIECLVHIAKGMSTKLIAKKMNLSFRTIETHIENMKERLGCLNKQDLLSKAWQSDYIKNKIIYQQTN